MIKLLAYRNRYLHTETETIKFKKFHDTNIENPANNARNMKDIYI